MKEPNPSHWNYRVIRHTDSKMQSMDPEAYFFSIHEVFYEEDKPMGWSSEAIAPLGETPGDLHEELSRMLRCLDFPVLRVEKGATEEEDRLVCLDHSA